MDLQAEIARIQRQRVVVRALIEDSSAFAERQRAMMQPLLERAQHSPPPWVFAVGGTIGSIGLISLGFLLGKMF